MVLSMIWCSSYIDILWNEGVWNPIVTKKRSPPQKKKSVHDIVPSSGITLRPRLTLIAVIKVTHAFLGWEL